jgi:hypothetical protein
VPFLLALEPIFDLAQRLTSIGLSPMIRKIGTLGDFVNGCCDENKINFCDRWIVKVLWQNESALPQSNRQVLHCGRKFAFVKTEQ